MSSSQILPHPPILRALEPATSAARLQKMHPGSHTDILKCPSTRNDRQIAVLCFVYQWPKMSFQMWSFPKEKGERTGLPRASASPDPLISVGESAGLQERSPGPGGHPQQPRTSLAAGFSLPGSGIGETSEPESPSVSYTHRLSVAPAPHRASLFLLS